MPKILHLFKERVFLDAFIEFLSRNYAPNDHHFIVWDNKNISSPDHEIRRQFEIKYYSKINIVDAYDISKKCDEYDLVIFHSLFLPVSLMVMLSFLPHVTKKSAWIIWGGDVYFYLEKKTPLLKMWEFFRRRVIRDFKFVVTWFRCDYDLAKKWYFVKGEYKEAWYVSPTMNIIKDHSSDPGSLRILVGNSATKSNRHIEVLEKLSKFKGENIEIYLPLSYGDLSYGETVAAKAREIFGDKAYPISDYIDPNEYRNFLSTIDIGIFNNDRQQALGNIFYLFFSGARIFVNPDSNLWKGLSEEYNFTLSDINEIHRLNFKKFSEIDEKIIDLNREKANMIISDAYQKPRWDDVFLMKAD